MKTRNNVKFLRLPSADIEWCQFLNGLAKPNPVTKVFIDLVRSKLPEFFLGCPMKGRIDIYDLEIKGAVLMILPKGVYKVVVKSFDDSKNPLLFISQKFQIED